MQRDVRTLNGRWHIAFDPGTIGKERGWTSFERFISDASPELIDVPACWERFRQDYEGQAWYGRTFAVPAEWEGRVIRVHFGAVNYRAEVWVNGCPAGWHEGGYTPFDIDLTGLVAKGTDNTLIVRVIGPILTRAIEIDGLGQDHMPHWRGAIAGGIWQDVELRATHAVSVRDVFVEASQASGCVRIRVAIENAGVSEQPAELAVRIVGAGDREASAAEDRQVLRVVPGTNDLAAELVVPNAVPWSPDAPHLYELQLNLRIDGSAVDSKCLRFGFREFTIRDGRFHLNGRPIFIKAVFDEGCYPNTLADVPDETFARRQIELVKAAGFNVLRLWRKPAPPLLLDLADEMGLMVFASPPIECMDQGPALTPQLEDRLSAEVRELVLRDRNHASVVCWEIFNEIVRPEMIRLRHRICLEARRHDATRLIIDESGGSRMEPVNGMPQYERLREYAKSTGPGVTVGANAYLPGSSVPVRVLERHRNLGAPMTEEDVAFFQTYGEPGVLGFMTECGGGAYPDLPRIMERFRRKGNPLAPDYRNHELLLEGIRARLSESGLDTVFPDLSAFGCATQEIQAEGNKLTLEALRTNPNMAGYCLHAWTGADWIIGSGIIDVWLEEPWPAYHVVRQINQSLVLVPRVARRNMRPEERTELVLQAVNERTERIGVLTVTLASPDGSTEMLHQDEATIPAGSGELLRCPITLGKTPGRWTVTTRFDGDTCGHTDLLVVAPCPALNLRVAAIDPDGELSPFVERNGMDTVPFDEGLPTTVPVVCCLRDAEDDAGLQLFRRLLNWVANGGTAVFLRPPMGWYLTDWDREGWVQSHRCENECNRLLREGVFPVQPARRNAQGNWIGLFHIVKHHPIFEGLPSGCLMGQDYANVYAKETMMNVPGEILAGAISIDWTRYYIGLSEVWLGSDLVLVQHGSGRLVLSALRLIENLGSDPVAERLLHNLIAFAGRDPAR